MNSLIPVLGMVSSNLFFAILSILGYEYEGASSSNLYILYSVTIFVMNILLCIKDILKDSKVNTIHIFMLSIPFFMLGNFLLTILVEGNINGRYIRELIFFILWPCAAIYGCVYIVRKNIIGSIVKWLDIIVVIYSLSIFLSAIVPFIKGLRFDSIGGATYQKASYIAATAYGINLYLMFYGSRYQRFKFTSHKLYKIISVLFIPVQLSSILISGGRGGMVLLFIYTIVISIFILKDKSKKNLIKYFIGFIVLITCIVIFIPTLVKNEIFKSGFERVFAFISPTGGINWNGTSGRDKIYSYILELIRDRPITGYGIFGALRFMDYAHNIILDILMHGGIIYLTIVLILTMWIIIKWISVVKYDKSSRIVIILFLYPITMLMFSGSYMSTSELWFTLTLLVLYDKDTNILNKTY